MTPHRNGETKELLQQTAKIAPKSPPSMEKSKSNLTLGDALATIAGKPSYRKYIYGYTSSSHPHLTQSPQRTPEEEGPTDRGEEEEIAYALGYCNLGED
jgi:hypothetical protein